MFDLGWRFGRRDGLAMVVALGLVAPHPAAAQHSAGAQASSNLRVLSHLPLGQAFHLADVELEQELSRPYAYVSRRASGFDVIGIRDPGRAQLLYSWNVANPELHQGSGAVGGSYLKIGERYYYAQSFQFGGNGPDYDLGAIVFDVTGLPDTSKLKVAGSIRCQRRSPRLA